MDLYIYIFTEVYKSWILNLDRNHWISENSHRQNRKLWLSVQDLDWVIIRWKGTKETIQHKHRTPSIGGISHH